MRRVACEIIIFQYDILKLLREDDFDNSSSKSGPIVSKCAINYFQVL